jgi:tripartite-type tricarboxylate transporter receptor subunit TctC
VLGTQRSPLLPDVPTMREAGLASYNFSNWFGLVGPAKMPADVVAKLQKDVGDVLKDPQVLERYKIMGLQAPAVEPAHFGALIRKDSDKWAATIKAAHIQPQ